MLAGKHIHIGATWFKSAPGWLAGRCKRQGPFTTDDGSFNPRPAGWPGDAAACSTPSTPFSSFNPRPAGWPGDARCRGVVEQFVFVSIRARLVGRAMPPGLAQIRAPRRFQSAPGWLAGRCRGVPRHCLAQAGFNPRPAGWPGDADIYSAIDAFATVSIRARLVGRAMLAFARRIVRMTRFQSAPGWLAGRCFLFYRLGLPRISFQSAPGWLAGRCRKSGSRAVNAARCFNPRPAGWPGDAEGNIVGYEQAASFNPRPAGWPGDAV